MRNFLLLIMLLSSSALIYAQPANDDCGSALPLGVDDGACGTPTIGTNVDATDSGIVPGCASYAGGDVWYSITVPAGGTVLIETSTAGGFTDGGMAAYSDCAGTLIECDDDDGPGLMPFLELSGLTPGSTIYVAVWEYGNNSFGDFGICAWSPPACADPTALTTSNATEGSLDVSWTSSAVATSSAVQLCPTGIPAGDASCIVVDPATSPTTFSGLDPCTTYDAYVQDLCGADQSTIVGPSTIATTGPAPVLMPACGETVMYPSCPGELYSSSESITWTLCAPAPDVAEIVFTYVDIESNSTCSWDYLVITYSDGTVEPNQCGEPDGDGGVGSGLAPGSTFTDPVAGGCMTVSFTSDGSVQETGFSFIFDCVAPVLPVKITDFNAQAMGNYNDINWSTITEVNNEFQIIERSLDGQTNWKEVDRVRGTNSNQKEVYNVKDKSPFALSYYRIQSIDFNGFTEYSHVVTVDRRSIGRTQNVQVTPNPFVDDLEVVLESDSDQNATIQMFTLSGKLVEKTTVNVSANTVERTLMDLSGLGSGVYLIRIEMGSTVETQRIVKVQ